MGKHTQGPWEAVWISGRYDIEHPRTKEDNSLVAESYEEADASLIAAAPELLEALERYVGKFGNCGDVYDQARAAIAKAKGES